MEVAVQGDGIRVVLTVIGSNKYVNDGGVGIFEEQGLDS